MIPLLARTLCLCLFFPAQVAVGGGSGDFPMTVVDLLVKVRTHVHTPSPYLTPT